MNAMTLCLKNAFLHVEGVNALDLPPANSRSVSEPPPARRSLESTDRFVGLDVPKNTSITSSAQVQLAADSPIAPCRGADRCSNHLMRHDAAPDKTTASILPLALRLKLNSLTKFGFEHHQRRMAEAVHKPASGLDLFFAALDYGGASQSSGSVSTDIPNDSDDLNCFDPGMTPIQTKARAHRRGKNKRGLRKSLGPQHHDQSIRDDTIGERVAHNAMHPSGPPGVWLVQ